MSAQSTEITSKRIDVSVRPWEAAYKRAARIKRFPRDVTILLIEHDMDVALELAERVIVLHFGRVIAAGPRDEIKRDPRVAEIYLGVDDAAASRTGEA